MHKQYRRQDPPACVPRGPPVLCVCWRIQQRIQGRVVSLRSLTGHQKRPVAHRAPEENSDVALPQWQTSAQVSKSSRCHRGVSTGLRIKFPPPPRPNRSFFRDRLQDGERFCPVGYSRISRSGADIRRHIRHRNTSAVRGHAPSSDRVQSRRCPMGGAWLVPPCCERPPVRSLWAFWK
jgi:hypothetical protein